MPIAIQKIIRSPNRKIDFSSLEIFPSSLNCYESQRDP